MLGPRDGEVISIVQANPTIEIMIQPEAPDGDREYDIAIYRLGRNLRPGVFQYNFESISHRTEPETPETS